MTLKKRLEQDLPFFKGVRRVPDEVCAGIEGVGFGFKREELLLLGAVMKFFYGDGLVARISAPVNIQGSMDLIRMRTNAITYSFTPTERELAITLSAQGIAKARRGEA